MIGQTAGSGFSDGRSTFADEACDEGGPSGLVRSAAAAAGVGVEEFVEEDEVLPCGIGGVAVVAAVAGPVAVGIRFEEPAHAAGDFMGCLLEGDVVTAAGGQFDGEASAVKMVIAFQCFDDQVGDGEPDRAAPV